MRKTVLVILGFVLSSVVTLAGDGKLPPKLSEKPLETTPEVPLVSVPPTAKSEVARPDGKKEVVIGKYIAGGIVGSTVGFGIGHGIQGRYAEKGWIFTVGEVAGALVMAGGLNNCTSTNSSSTSIWSGCANNSTFYSGIALVLGFHIWEVIDVWMGARPVPEKLEAFIVPTPNGTQLGLSFKF